MDKDTGTFIKGEYKDDTDSQQVILKGDGTKLLSLIIHIIHDYAQTTGTKHEDVLEFVGYVLKHEKFDQQIGGVAYDGEPRVHPPRYCRKMQDCHGISGSRQNIHMDSQGNRWVP